MWSDAQADPPACPGGGAPASPASPLPDGFPHGLALCRVCHGFVPLTEAVDDGRAQSVLAPHAAFTGTADARRRAEWFNAHGWE